MTDAQAYFPLAELADVGGLPFGDILDNILTHIWITEPLLDTTTNEGVVGVFVDQAVSFKIPGIPSLELALGYMPGGVNADVRARFQPKPHIGIELPLTLRVDAAVLRPLKTGTNEPDLDKKTLDIKLGSVRIGFDTDGNFTLDAPTGITLPRCMISSTGVILEVGKLSWLTPSDPTPAGATDPPPAGFTGLYIDDAQIHLPDIDFLPSTVRFDDCYIGTGGFTGKVSFPSEVEWDSTKNEFKGDMAGELFGFKCGLKNIEIAFVQTCLQKGLVVGEIFVPYLEKRIGIEMNLNMSGEFRVALIGPQSKNPDTGVEMRSDGLLKLRKNGVVEALLDSVSFEKKTLQAYSGLI